MARRQGWGDMESTTGHNVASMRQTNDGQSSASAHSLFADELDDNDHLGNRKAEQKILDNANFGVSKLQLRSGKSNTRRSSTKAINDARALIRRRSSDLAISWAARIQKSKWKDWMAPILLWLRLLDSIYILFSAPFRMGFFFDPWVSPDQRSTWTTALTVFTIFDLAGVVLRISYSRKDAYPLLQRATRTVVEYCSSRVHPSDRPRYFSMIRASFIGEANLLTLRSQASGASGRGDKVSAADTLPFRHRSKSASHRHALLLFVATVLNCFPTELVIICFTRNYNVLHLVGFTRFVQAVVSLPRQFSDLVLARYRHLRVVQALSFGTIATIAYLFVAGIYGIHCSASGYMFLAHWECGMGFNECESSSLRPGSWVHRDRLERGAFERKFARALYWASKTVTTLGQGDLVPATEAETLYRIFIQFISGLWATAILTAYSFYFSRKDAKMATNLTTRLEQATTFLSTRRLPATLMTRVRTYFQYMQRTRFGVEEDLILKGLPPHYHQQCLNFVKYKSFQRLPWFKKQDGAFLRTVLRCLEKDYYAPGQVVLSIGDAEEMFVVASGEINIVNSTNATMGRLVPGNSHAERALFTTAPISMHTLIAETHCEVWILHHDAFMAAMKKHFSRLKYASMVTSNALKSSQSGQNRLSSLTGDLMNAMRRLKTVERAPTSKLLRKLSTDLEAIVATAATESKQVIKPKITWQMPTSRFRRMWRHAKCLLLLFQLYEVPYHIAFQRGFGVLTASDSPVFGAIPMTAQYFDFVVTVLVEIFFYVDWFFRACCFFRYTSGSDTLADGSESGGTFALLKDRWTIFRHYRENDPAYFDLVVHTPLALVWDILPKHNLSDTVVSMGRFIRLLRLLRLVSFRRILRELMVAHALSPSKRMLIYVLIFCTASAHFAACLFFLIGDQRHFYGGLPRGGSPFQSMTAFDCLQDATLYRNCTWYMYDRSTFDIDAPFLRSLQWSIVLLSTVGYGEILSFSTRESMVGCVWIFLGANICYCTGCVLSSILGQLNVLHTVQQDRMEEINLALMSAPNVSEETKILIRSYYVTKWQLNGSAGQDTEVLKHVPRSIRQEMRVALHADDLQHCYLFASNSPSRFVRELARIARCEIFLSGIMIVREGHIATEFFVMQSGEAELLLPPIAASSAAVSTMAVSERQPRTSIVQSYRQIGQKIATWKGGSTRDLEGSSSFQRTNTGSTLPAPELTTDTQTNVSRESSVPFLRASAIYSRGMKLSSLDLRLAKLRRRSSTENRLPYSKGMIPISILQQHDCFGEESLTPSGQPRTYQVNVRVVASAQVAVIRRRDLLALSTSFPREFHNISRLLVDKAEQDEVLFRALQRNFMLKDKIARCMGIPQSLYVDRSKLAAGHQFRYLRVVDPEELVAVLWSRIVSAILAYNFYVVIFRVAFLPTPKPSTMAWLTAIDYVCDFILYADIVLKFGWFGYIEHGHKCMDSVLIRKRYVSTWFKQDCWSMLPLFYRGNFEIMTFCRLPRILKSPQLVQIMDNIQVQIQERFLRENNTKLLGVFDLFRFVLIFVSTAHYVGSLYYLLGRLQLASGFVERSWISVDDILRQYPGNVAVHYMRALYWCLSTFTVDCFGDILARNFLETVFSMGTCILGWIFIGQVIGRINVLMMALDKEAKQQAARIFDFDQYARQRKLPVDLHHQALQSLAFKSECLLDLRQVEIFRDLPKGLQVHLFHEMYSPLLTHLVEFQGLSKGQLEAIASSLCVEIYLPGDVIFDAGRVGKTLYFLKQGLVELFSPHSHVVFAAVETGCVFGECAFFIRGSKRLTSARAVRSCQVLQLDRARWNRLWPTDVRDEVEHKLMPIVRKSYRDNARAYFSISKNFYLKNENAKPPLSVSQRARVRRPPPKMAPQQPAVASEPPPDAKLKRRPSLVGLLFRNPIAMGSSSVSPQLERRGSDRTGSHRSVDAGSVGSSGGSSSLNRQSSHSSVGAINEAAAVARTSISSAAGEGPRRKSSLSAFAEALGLRDQMKPRPSTATKLPPLLASVPSERFQLVRRESRRGYGLEKLSAATELKWRRHAKKLAAIRMFEASMAHVDKDLTATATLGSIHRRASVSVFPTVAEALTIRRTATNEAILRRRYSIGLAASDLRLERLAFDPFQLDHADHNVKTTDEVNHAADDVEDEAIPRPHRSHRRRTSVESNDGSFSLSTLVKEIVGVSRKQRRGRGRKVAPSDFKTTTVAHEIWVPPPPGSDMFRDGSRFRQSWDMVMLVITIYYGVIVPFRACFLHDHMDDPTYYTAVVSSFALEYILTDIICVLDFVLQRHHFEFSQHGEIVSDRARISQHYWEHGTYMADLLSIVPLEALAIGSLYLPTTPMFSAGFYTPPGALPVWRTLAFARINRTLRAFVHLHPLSDRVQRYALYDLKISWLRPSVCYLIRIALDFALGTHWIACVFYGASYLLHVEGSVSWLTTPGMLVFHDGCDTLQDVSRVPVATKYLRSFHFSIGAVTTVCYGDILPMNAIENTVTIVIIFLSVGLFSMLSGTYLKLFEMELGKRADYEEKVSQVGQLMVFHQFPAKMWKQMQVYFALSWQESKGMHEEEMLRGLTKTMRYEITTHVHANLLKHVKLLSACDPHFARALVSVLQHELYVRNDVIIQRGDRGRTMYIIETGLVSIRRPESKRKSSVSHAPPRHDEDRPSNVPVQGATQDSPTNRRNSRLGSAATLRLRSTKELLRDVKAAAAAAASPTSKQAGEARRPSAVPSPPGRPSIAEPGHSSGVPASPSEDVMWRALHSTPRDMDDDSPTMKMRVAPRQSGVGSVASKSAALALGSNPPASAIVAAAKEGSLRGTGVNDIKFVKGPFDYFGERSLLFGTPRMATCVALCVCSVYVLTPDKYNALLDEFPHYRRRNIQDWVLNSVKPIPNDASTKR